MRLKLTLTLVLALGPVAWASAAETIAYTYDAQGRVTQVLSTGSVNGTTSTCYYYDNANNLVRQAVVSSTVCP